MHFESIDPNGPVSPVAIIPADLGIVLPPTAKEATAAFAVSVEDRPTEGGDPTYGEVTWRTLISGDRTASDEVVLGVAEFTPHGRLLPHRHVPAEFYFGLTGEGTVTIDGEQFRIAKGVAIFVPGNAEHGVVAGPEGLTFAYGFGRDSFAEVAYVFSGAARQAA